MLKHYDTGIPWSILNFGNMSNVKNIVGFIHFMGKLKSKIFVKKKTKTEIKKKGKEKEEKIGKAKTPQSRKKHGAILILLRL